jgi:hypothetical protein
MMVVFRLPQSFPSDDWRQLMSPCDTDTFAVLCAADPDVMDRDQLADLTGQLAAHQAWCDALEVRITRRQRQLAADGHAEPARDLLSRTTILQRRQDSGRT